MISATGLLLALGLFALLGLAVVIVWWVYRTPPGYRRRREEDLPLFSVSLVESRRAPARPMPSVTVSSSNGSSAMSYAPSEPSRAAAPSRSSVSSNARATQNPQAARPERELSGPVPARAHSEAPVRAAAVPVAQAAPETAPVAAPVTSPMTAPVASREMATPPASATAVRDVRPAPAPIPTVQAPGASNGQPPAQMMSADGVPGTQIEGHLLRFSVPQDGTLQFLPGRLEILNGLDVGREVRFVRVPGADGTHVTFGRSEGPAYRHVQLREGTVSRQHARMELRESQWHLTNLSATNPVAYNEQVLAVGEERSLVDGDRIEMGEVVFGFRSR